VSDSVHNKPTQRSRGAISNPANRFESLAYENDADGTDDFEPSPVRTEFYRDATQSVLTRNNSPDVSFDVSLNPYRGCEHGCVYCFARPTHEFLGFSSGLDFESRIVVKENAPELLRKELAKRSYRPEPIALSPNTDCYQPIERKLKLTRRCLEVFAEFRNPVGIVTKNALVTRDLDLLCELARYDAVNVFISVTTLDPELRRILEPRTSPPAARLRAIRELSEAGIPTGVLVAPIIPAINDHEIPKLVAAAGEAGATSAGYVLLRLPHSVAPMFEEWLGEHFPDRKEKVLNQVRSMRSGELYESEYGKRMTGNGIHAEKIAQLFEIAVRKAKLNGRRHELCTAHFRRPPGNQMELFE
jgi:DNA repair photolyase